MKISGFCFSLCNCDRDFQSVLFSRVIPLSLHGLTVKRLGNFTCRKQSCFLPGCQMTSSLGCHRSSSRHSRPCFPLPRAAAEPRMWIRGRQWGTLLRGGPASVLPGTPQKGQLCRMEVLRQPCTLWHIADWGSWRESGSGPCLLTGS